MKNINRTELFHQSVQSLETILNWLEKVPSIAMSSLPDKNTALVIMDMVNGFASEGALMSPRIRDLLPEIAALSQRCGERGMAKIAFADSHSENCPEFGAFPTHCVTGTREAELLDELAAPGDFTLIPKNSTNAFMERVFLQWLDKNPQITAFIVTGCCTDICILQFSLALKSWFNAQNRESRIIVPVNAVNTYHSPDHNGDLAHVMGLRNMHVNGIEIAGGIV